MFIRIEMERIYYIYLCFVGIRISFECYVFIVDLNFVRNVLGVGELWYLSEFLFLFLVNVLMIRKYICVVKGIFLICMCIGFIGGIYVVVFYII